MGTQRKTLAAATSLLFSALCLLLPDALRAAEDRLETVAEQSGFERTGRYEEVIDLCSRFQLAYPKKVRCEDFGITPEGRPMKLLITSGSGVLDASEAKRQRLPVILFQAGIHAGEISGKDAGFWALREMLEGKVSRGALDKLIVLFVPVFNVDGHERFGRWNRPNQRGPEEMGWRTTAQNLNLNRDYMKVDTPEMAQMLELLNRWDPIAFADLHATDGAQFEHDISIMVEPNHAGLPFMRVAGRALRDTVIDRLVNDSHLPIPFYPSFVVEDDPASGFKDGPGSPRFSLSYVALRNRFSMLVENHSWRPYRHRVKATFNLIAAYTSLCAEQGPKWRTLADRADRESRELGGKRVPLSYEANESERRIDFRGYSYTRKPSEISGTLVTRYDESEPQIWSVPMRDQVIASKHARLPEYAYVVPLAQSAWIAPKLHLHGIKFDVLDQPLKAVRGLEFRSTKISTSPSSFEGRQLTTLEGEWRDQSFDLSVGSLIIKTSENNGYLLAALLEPEAPDSWVSWGFFNNYFEPKEYMEPYVAESVARELLEGNPSLAKEFQQRLASDRAFAADPGARLDFFYQHHASFDQRFGVYPVLKVDRIDETQPGNP